jgi:hypothetical protein
LPARKYRSTLVLSGFAKIGTDDFQDFALKQRTLR